MLKTLDPGEYQFIKTWHAVFLPRWVDAWSKGVFNDQEHHLFFNEQGEYELVPVREVPQVAAGRVKAFLFHRLSESDDTYAVLWANEGRIDLTLPIFPEHLTVMRPFGAPVSFEKQGERAIVEVGNRRYLRLAGIGSDQAIHILNAARQASRKVDRTGK